MMNITTLNTTPNAETINNEDYNVIGDYVLTLDGDALHAFINELTLEQRVNLATLFNIRYRNLQNNIPSDTIYDTYILTSIAELDPNHPFLNSVESDGNDAGGEELGVGGKVLTLPRRMLSTDKAYGFDPVNNWLKRLERAAAEIGLPDSEITLRLTPKLDGFAAQDDGTTMYTRGNGVRGTDITRVIERGLQRFNDDSRDHEVGEIVVDVMYFEEYLADDFSNTRNVIAAVLKESEPDASIKQAIADKGVVFAPFSKLKAVTTTVAELRDNFDTLTEEARSGMPFDLDGVVIETTNDALKLHMGATQKAHRWMVALKQNEAPVSIPVLAVTPQTSRAGRVVPVAELTPTEVSGVIVSRATCHNYKYVNDKGIGKGAVIGLVRSGLVIPKIVETQTSVSAVLPEHCPSCGEPLSWEEVEEGKEPNDLVCTNKESCPAQASKRLLHFFTQMQNVDGFGFKTTERLSKHGIAFVEDIYRLQHHELVAMGFGDKQSQNLIDELERSRNQAVEDTRFLSAFGIKGVGVGVAEILLKQHKLDLLFSLTHSDLVAIPKIGDKTADALIHGLSHIKKSFDELYGEIGFNLIPTPLASETPDVVSPIAGKVIVFTGTMVQGSRDDMKKQAKALGATVGSGVSGKTDYLVTGEKVGARKTEAAENLGVTVLTEAQYLEMLAE